MLTVVPDDEQQNIIWYGRFEKTDSEISAWRPSSMDNVQNNREHDTGRPIGSRRIHHGAAETRRGTSRGPDETVSEERQLGNRYVDELPEES